jgi:hypothetical protein
MGGGMAEAGVVVLREGVGRGSHAMRCGSLWFQPMSPASSSQIPLLSPLSQQFPPFFSALPVVAVVVVIVVRSRIRIRSFSPVRKPLLSLLCLRRLHTS